jgi:excisionase family DNA binding protein
MVTEPTMSARKRPLSKDEIRSAFEGAEGQFVPPILSPKELSSLLGLSVKTLYEWISRGRLDGAYRKRGKHVLIWRDRAVDLLLNGKEWSDVG